MNILSLSATNIPEMIRTKKASAREICEVYLKRVEQLNPKLNAFLRTHDEALAVADKIDQSKTKEGKLLGIPIAVKDNFCVEGAKTTAASRILENFKPPYTAHSIARLQAEGAIIIGKTNLDEFAMGSSNENSYFGACKNPWDVERVPGGSSGGSAVSVAARLAPIAIGSDTGGSIRQPASFCGVVGIKPTYGSVSRFGMIAFASSLDQAGTFAKTVDEAALALDVMIDNDSRDATNVKSPFSSLLSNSMKDLRGVRVGLAKEYLEANVSEDIKNKINDLVKELKSAGAEIIEVSLPHTEYAIPVYYLVAASEASSNLSRYDGVRYGLRDIEQENGRPVKDLAEFYKSTRSRGFGDEVKRRILLGTFSLSAGYYDAFYTKACRVRRLISNDFSDAFKKCEFIIGPVSTDTAFKIGEKTNDPLAMYYNDILTTPANLAGLPTMSLPVGLDGKSLPIGLQIIAPAFCDDKMISFRALNRTAASRAIRVASR